MSSARTTNELKQKLMTLLDKADYDAIIGLSDKHPPLLRLERKDVAGPSQVGGFAIRIDGGLDRRRTIRCGDAGRNVAARIHGDRECGPE